MDRPKFRHFVFSADFRVPNHQMTFLNALNLLYSYTKPLSVLKSREITSFKRPEDDKMKV